MRLAWPAFLLLVVSGCAATSPTSPPAPAGTPPTITKQPVDQVGQRLGVVTFSVTATGAAPLMYQWHRDTKPWPHWDGSSLTLTAVSDNDVGTYTVTITNAAGSVTSAGARLTLSGSPPPPNPAVAVTAPARRSVRPAAAGYSEDVPTEYADVGKPLQLTVAATGKPPFTYEWRKDGRLIAGATGAVLDLKAVRLADAGSYACIVTNAAGSAASRPIQVVVRKP